MITKILSPQEFVAYIGTNISNFRKATTTKETFLEYLQTRDSEKAGAWSWTNEGVCLVFKVLIYVLITLQPDLLPTPRDKRTWKAWNYAFFYSSLAMDNWTLGSSLIGVGLNWWQAIVAILIAQFIGASASALNSRCAETYHIGFPVVARSVFGMYGAYYAVGARAVLALIYYSLKSL